MRGSVIYGQQLTSTERSIMNGVKGIRVRAILRADAAATSAVETGLYQG